MADNVQLNLGTGGDSLGADDISGVKYQRVKMIHGADGVNDGDVSSANPMPIEIFGTSDGGVPIGIKARDEGHLEVAITGPKTAFGEVQVAQMTPVSQVDFVYGLNSETTNTTNTGIGSASASGALLTVQTGANTNSSSQVVTRRSAKYRPGQGVNGRFTALYTTGAANSKQYAGLFDEDFDEGFGFGYNGTAFGIVSIKGGTETWVDQTVWSVDTMDGDADVANPSGVTLDPTKGNVFMIQFQYLGFGAIRFLVENPTTGEFQLVHTIEFANANTETSLNNPTVRIGWRAENTSNGTNIQVKAASGALFIEGLQRLLGPQHSSANSKASITTETSVIALRNATTYNTVDNEADVHLRSISFGANSGGSTTGIAFLRIVLNPTIGGTPSYSPVSGSTSDNGVTITSGESVVSVDTAGTTVTGGIVIYSSVIAVGTTSGKIDLTDADIVLDPGDVAAISIESTQAVTAGVGVNWSEDI